MANKRADSTKSRKGGAIGAPPELRPRRRRDISTRRVADGEPRATSQPPRKQKREEDRGSGRGFYKVLDGMKAD